MTLISISKCFWLGEVLNLPSALDAYAKSGRVDVERYSTAPSMLLNTECFPEVKISSDEFTSLGLSSIGTLDILPFPRYGSYLLRISLA